MDNNSKNIVILKNLPSNIVEEAIVVVKNKKNIMDINSLKRYTFLNFKSKDIITR